MEWGLIQVSKVIVEGQMVVDSWIETCCCLDGKCGYFVVTRGWGIDKVVAGVQVWC